MFETYYHCQLISCPSCQEWVDQVGREAKIKGFSNLYFFFLFYHLSRSICFSLGKFKLFILTSSYNLLSKGFYFELRKLEFFSPFCGINIVWLGKKKEDKELFQLQANGVLSIFTAVNYLIFTCGNMLKGEIQRQRWNTNS